MFRSLTMTMTASVAFAARLLRRRTLLSSLSSSRACRRSFSFLPLPSSRPQRIIFGSCSCQREDLSYWDTLVAQHPDLVLLLGDNVYGGKNIKDLIKAYKVLGSHSSYQRATQSVPILATLDDNDYGNGGDACAENPYKDEAKYAFLDFFQVPKEDERWRANRGVYTSRKWQDDLEIIMLDLRYHKSPFLDTHEPGAPGKQCHVPDHEDDSKTMLGDEQWEWLEGTLKEPCLLRFLVSPLQVMAKGHGFECWRMLPVERERLLSMIKKNKGTTVILSGDRHASAFYQIGDLVEVTSSSLTHTVTPGLLDNETDITRNGDFIYCNNFGRIDIDWENRTVLLSMRRSDTGEEVESRSIEWFDETE